MRKWRKNYRKEKKRSEMWKKRKNYRKETRRGVRRGRGERFTGRRQEEE